MTTYPVGIPGTTRSYSPPVAVAVGPTTPTFNPYHKWLGIEPSAAVDLYRLLGIRSFEADPDVIDNAAQRQMNHVRTFQHGPHANWSQRLLNEIAAARHCLLTPRDKLIYDHWLRQHDEAARQVTPPPVVVRRTFRRSRPRTAFDARWSLLAAACVVGVLLLLLGGAWQLSQATLVVDWPEHHRVGGSVYLDGRPVPLRPHGLLVVPCRPGLHEIRLVRSDGREFRQRCDLTCAGLETVKPQWCSSETTVDRLPRLPQPVDCGRPNADHGNPAKVTAQAQAKVTRSPRIDR